MSTTHKANTIKVSTSYSGKRLDTFVSLQLSDYSRSFASLLIRNGNVLVHGSPKKPSYRVKPGDLVLIQPPAFEPTNTEPEPIDLEFLYEDESIAVINKPAGMVVHPAPGHSSGTLVNALLHHFPNIEGIGGEQRPGIVHRLDKDTSGILVIAKNQIAHNRLSCQFKYRKIRKEYLALVHGEMSQPRGTISLSIGRHPTDRKRMSTVGSKSRPAETFWKVKEHFHHFTLLQLIIKTGRTHQIRVHCAALHHPIIGDPVYGCRMAGRNLSLSIKSLGSEIISVKNTSRQMLHAWRIGFSHPITQKDLHIEAPLPQDMISLLHVLRQATVH
jgi:23S rRNA pseudouridine1911/1915/1917 synthase